ncbi:MAG: SMC family ATPase, partial [Actinobacteria bacterium]|nr:SMC family ATPase [Actinomycetota bacterium]
MKLHRLEIEGFGPFRDRQLVDFDAFADDGIFLIAGRTGAGKSSLLDGVCFALYGGVPRYDGGEKRLRSDHCEPDDPTEVRLEFTVAGVRWRVTRSPEYPRRKRRGDGFTIEGARAQLEEFVDGGWRGTASGPRDVALELDEILGLTQDQFLQVILLAQNKFQRFLLAKNDERQAVLRTLFGSRRYEEYQNALEGRRREAERALTSRGDALGLLLGEAERIVREHDLGGDASDGPTGRGAARPDERRDALERATQRADYRASAAVRDRDAADAAHTAATAAHAAQTALHALHEQRARSRDAFARLEGEAAEVAADRERHDRALRAETLRATLDAARRTAEAAHRTADLVEAARALWMSAGGADLDAPALRALIDDLTGHLAVWEAARGREREHDDLAQRLLGEHTAVAELQKALAALDEQRGNIPEELARVDADLRTAGDAAAVLDSVREQLAEVHERLVAAREAEQLAKDLRIADIAHAERVEAYGTATTAVGALMRTRLAGFAGELASALVDGEPCTVCGALEHPAPAERSHSPVTDDEVTAAEAQRELAAEGEREAAVRARAARDAHAAAAVRAGGDPTDHLEEAHARAQSAVDAAVSAATRRDALAEQRSQLVAFDTASAAERADLVASLASAREKVAVTTTTVDALAAAVTAARGEFDTVAARIADATRIRAL